MANIYSVMVQLRDKGTKQVMEKKVDFWLPIEEPHLNVSIVETDANGDKYIETIVREKAIGKKSIESQ